MTVLLVILFFSLLLLVDYLIRRRQVVKSDASITTIQRVQGMSLSNLHLPKGVFFHPGHAWAVVRPEGRLRVGIDDFVCSMAGQIDNIEPLEHGTKVKQGEPLLKLGLDGRTLTLESPVSGTITNVNRNMLDNLSRMDQSDLSTVWIVDLLPSRLSEELPSLNIAEQARNWLMKELERFSEFLNAQSNRPELAGITLQDGGEPIAGVVRMLDEQALEQFEREFLHTDAQVSAGNNRVDSKQ